MRDLGSFLSDTPRPAPAPRVRPPRPPGTAAIVTQALTERPMTMRELVARTGASLDRVNAALYLLQQQGRVVKVERRARADSAYGRQVEYVYGMAG